MGESDYDKPRARTRRMVTVLNRFIPQTPENQEAQRRILDGTDVVARLSPPVDSSDKSEYLPPKTK